MPPKGTGAPYKNGNRWWGDVRSFADVGGDREPLIPPGETLATKDPGQAREIYDARRTQLKQKRTAGTRTVKSMLPADYTTEVYLPHLEQKKRSKRGQRADEPLKRKDDHAVKKVKHAITTCLHQPSARNAVSLRDLGTSEMTRLISDLHKLKLADETYVSPQTVRRHLMELSGMFDRARFEQYMDINPLKGHPDIPPLKRGSALDPDGYLTRDEVRRMLEQVVPNPKSPWAVEQAYVLFYTGCRLDELNGILVRDVDFAGDIINIVEHKHRSLKSTFSRRQIPLWPKLAAVLRASLERSPRPANGLLFPRAGSRSEQDLEDQMMTRIRKSLKSAALRAGIAKDIGHHIARHSYVSARREMVELSPLGKHVPVPNAVIVREVGHATDELIQTTYGHLPAARVAELILDYRDAPVDLDERVRRAKQLMSEAVKAGVKRSKERRAEEERARKAQEAAERAAEAGESPKTKKAPRGRGQSKKAKAGP